MLFQLQRNSVTNENIYIHKEQEKLADIQAHWQISRILYPHQKMVLCWTEFVRL